MECQGRLELPFQRQYTRCSLSGKFDVMNGPQIHQGQRSAPLPLINSFSYGARSSSPRT